MTDFRIELPEGHGIIATLDDDGVITFVVLAGQGSPIRGREMFDLMMRSFSDKVRAVRGVWRKGVDGRPSANIDKVNELTASGVTMDQAVPQTWTARQASRWGYSRVGLLRPEGVPGDYVKIDVLFVKQDQS